MVEIISFLKQIVEKYGTQFIVALSAIYAIYMAMETGKVEGLYGVICIAIIVICYYVTRTIKENKEKETTP